MIALNAVVSTLLLLPKLILSPMLSTHCCCLVIAPLKVFLMGSCFNDMCLFCLCSYMFITHALFVFAYFSVYKYCCSLPLLSLDAPARLHSYISLYRTSITVLCV